MGAGKARGAASKAGWLRTAFGTDARVRIAIFGPEDGVGANDVLGDSVASYMRAVYFSPADPPRDSLGFLLGVPWGASVRRGTVMPIFL